MNRLFRIALVLAGVAFAVPGGSGGTSTLDPQPKSQSWRVEAGAASGDSVTWTFGADEPHTVSLLAPGQALPPPWSPTVSNPAGGKTYDGTPYTSSGFKLLGGTYMLRFTKPERIIAYSTTMPKT